MDGQGQRRNLKIASLYTPSPLVKGFPIPVYTRVEQYWLSFAVALVYVVVSQCYCRFPVVFALV